MVHPRAQSDAAAPDGAQVDVDFEEWWITYGRVGSKARARDLYRWWRQRKDATRHDLLTAAQAYRAHCEASSCKMKHADTFLAKATKNRSAVWPEWASGEEHGTMDVGDPAPTGAYAQISVSGDDLHQMARRLKRMEREDICERCHRERFSDTPLTYDEDGLHCPVCGWRPTSVTRDYDIEGVVVEESA